MADAPNSISLAPFDRKDWIVRKEKYNRYKIVNYKKFHKRKQGIPRSGTAVFVFDKGDKLTLSVCNYMPRTSQGAKVQFNSSYTNYNIKIRDGRLVVWNVEHTHNEFAHAVRRIRNKSCMLDAVKKKVLSFGNKSTYNRKFPTQEEIEAHENRLREEVKKDDFIDFSRIELMGRDPFYPEVIKVEDRQIKIANERLNKILLHFLKRNKIKIPRSKDFFENLRVACYRHTAGFKLESLNLNSHYSRHFAHGDLKYVIKKTFGHDSAKLVKLICERIQKDKSLDCLLIGCFLKRLIPLDYFQQLVPNMSVNILKNFRGKNPENTMRTARKILKRYNAARVLKLIQAGDFQSGMFTDSVRMFAHAPEGIVLPEKPKNWHEIHDRLMPIQAQIERAQAEAQQAEWKKANEFELPVRKHMEPLDNAVVDDLRLEVPKHTKDLAAYSEKLHHCIWSYGHAVKEGTDILAVYRGSDLLYNIAMRNKRIEQFRGVRNSEPNPQDKKKVQDFLFQKKVVEPVERSWNQLVVAPQNGVLVPMAPVGDFELI